VGYYPQIISSEMFRGWYLNLLKQVLNDFSIILMAKNYSPGEKQPYALFGPIDKCRTLVCSVLA
jgi:hypothetical protein